MSDDQAAVRALPPTDLFSDPSSLEPPVTVQIVSVTPLQGSRKQRLDDNVYPDQQPARYPTDRDRLAGSVRSRSAGTFVPLRGGV